MDYKYYIELMRFKLSGKYYDTVTFGTNQYTVNDVIDEILVQAHKNIISQEFDYLITGNGFDDGQGYPHLVKYATTKAIVEAL